FGLTVFGVNLTRLAPGAWSMAHHKHKRQDELIYVLEGTPVLVTDAGETQLSPGMCAGFPAGGAAHHLENRSSTDAVILEVGDRTSGEEIECPNDDVRAILEPNGGWRFAHIDGSPL
ncbi:MAG: cupin domain-containing protein, partial [Acetobacteraceae bacterium]|nr:cupin domain-containing protein [Acetobacteraceae bacterium]